MSFVSLSYYFFLCITAIVFYSVKSAQRAVVLLIASYFFYISYDYRFIFFILTTTIVSYFSSLYMESSKDGLKRKLALMAALFVEFSLLFATKYLDSVLSIFQFKNPFHILVPIGISFYTFQTIGYLFDVYRRQISAEKNYIRFSVFLSFFPHLLAGPVELAQDFLPQIQTEKKPQSKIIWLGLCLILVGLFKKLVIADRISHVVNIVFGAPDQHQGMAVGFAVFLARYQIYCDFSGYTDIALGSAQILGFKMTQNFNQPFFASSITEYWQRWHISLAKWIRRYVFYPLVVTPIARLGVHSLILLTFLLLGLWHGGTTNYLIYGLWHGLFVILDSSSKEHRQKFYEKIGLSHYPKALNVGAIVTTFFCIVVPPTLFFRAESFHDSQILLSNLLEAWSLSSLDFIFNSEFLIYSLKIGLFSIVLLELLTWFVRKFNVIDYLMKKSSRYTIFCCIAILTGVLVFGYFQSDSRFIYMRF